MLTLGLNSQPSFEIASTSGGLRYLPTLKTATTPASLTSVTKKHPPLKCQEQHPPDPHDEHTMEEATTVDDTLVRSVIVVSTDEPGCLSAIAPSVHENTTVQGGVDARRDAASAEETHGSARRPETSASARLAPDL
ncbi:hypothetical protein ARSEF4850_006867 [Beauveria asiatica]